MKRRSLQFIDIPGVWINWMDANIAAGNNKFIKSISLKPQNKGITWVT
jgi:hypothetical protein